MAIFKSVKKLGNQLNPVHVGKPGAKLIKDSFDELTSKRRGVVLISSLDDNERRYRVRFLRRGAVVSVVTGSFLAALSFYSGVTYHLWPAMLMAIMIFAGSMVIALMRSWEASMVESGRSVSLDRYIVSLFQK